MELTAQQVEAIAISLSGGIKAEWERLAPDVPHRFRCYPIPNGGFHAAAYLKKAMDIEIVLDPNEADFLFDDIIDSGKTHDRWTAAYPGKPFYALVNNGKGGLGFDSNGEWVTFPWEESPEKSITDNITRLLQYAGDDPNREGLLDTPARVAKAFDHWFSGYGKNAAEILKSFEDGGESYDEMVVVKDIPIYSKCEHHMADIFGTATIAYIPNGRIVGLSKLSRLADMYARRLQVQERLTQQIANALWENLKPLGVGVSISARHLCMESRGICQTGHYTITTALRGALKHEKAARSEFLGLVRG